MIFIILLDLLDKYPIIIPTVIPFKVYLFISFSFINPPLSYHSTSMNFVQLSSELIIVKRDWLFSKEIVTRALAGLTGFRWSFRSEEGVVFAMGKS